MHDSVYTCMWRGTCHITLLSSTPCGVLCLILPCFGSGPYPGRDLWNGDAQQIIEEPGDQERADRSSNLSHQW